MKSGVNYNCFAEVTRHIAFISDEYIMLIKSSKNNCNVDGCYIIGNFTNMESKFFYK